MFPIRVAMSLRRIDVMVADTLTPIVSRRINYLVFAPNFLSALNAGFGFKGVNMGAR